MIFSQTMHFPCTLYLIIMSILTPGKGCKTGEKGRYSLDEETERDLNLFYLTPKDQSFSWSGDSFSRAERGRGTLAVLLSAFRPRASTATLLANYVKHDGQPATSIDSHRRMFYGAYYFREEQSSSSVEPLVSHSREFFSSEKIRFRPGRFLALRESYNRSRR